MQPHEIKPDTKLCTILGYNAQTGYTRKYFNKLLKHDKINATAIALNISDEHFVFTMSSVSSSKVDKMLIEREFQEKAVEYCDNLDKISAKSKKVDFIEIADGKVSGFSLDEEIEKLFDNPDILDEQIQLMAKMMIVANRWFDTNIDIDNIPLLIGDLR